MSKILGVIIWARHGDRQGFYQDPVQYTASATAITPLGEAQELQLGSYLQSTYLDPSAELYIGTSFPIFNQSQVQVRADAGGEGGVIFDSSVALLQGLFPPTSLYNTTLANGTTVVSPLGGYQYVPIESVEPNEDVSLEGFTSCTTQATRTTQFYNSSSFQAVASANADFLNSLPPFLDGRPVTLQNMFNIWDYMQVQTIHNATFAGRLPAGDLQHARTLANYHEYGVFSDANFSGIGNIAARTAIPSMMTAMQRIANASDPLKLHYTAMSYKPFLSFFNMSGVVADGQLPGAVVNYAAAMAIEIWQDPTAPEPTLRLRFKNGTDDAAFTTHPMSFPGFANPSGGDAPLSAFLRAFEPAAVNTTLQWCGVCGQEVERGCAALLGAANSSSSSSSSSSGSAHHDRISPVGAGFLGAGLTLAVALMLLVAAMFFGVLSFGAGGRKGRRSGSQRGLNSEQGSTHDEKHA